MSPHLPSCLWSKLLSHIPPPWQMICCHGADMFLRAAANMLTCLALSELRSIKQPWLLTSAELVCLHGSDPQPQLEARSAASWRLIWLLPHATAGGSV